MSTASQPLPPEYRVQNTIVTDGLGKALTHPYNIEASWGKPTRPGMPSTSCYFDANATSHGRSLAYDIGVNQAGDARALLYKGYRVVSVEADPRKYRKLMADTLLARYRQTKQWTLINAAIVGRSADSSGNVRFYIYHSKPDSSTTDPRACFQSAGACSNVSVPKITCGELVRRFGVGFVLKSDIEEADDQCFETLMPEAGTVEDEEVKPLQRHHYNWHLPPYVQFETFLPGTNASADRRARVPWRALQLLKMMGYSDFKLTNQRDVQNFGLGPAFSGGDEWSGPIGEEAVDTVTRHHWNTYENVVERLRRWQAWQEREHRFAWIDVAARLNPDRLCDELRPPYSRAPYVARCAERTCEGRQGRYGKQ